MCSIPALTVFVAYAPTSDYDDEDVEAFYVELEKFYRKITLTRSLPPYDVPGNQSPSGQFHNENDHIIISHKYSLTDGNSQNDHQLGPLHSCRLWEDTVMDNID
ncbi:unnamed protein product [Heligmosomoides polygyrus]|uniref:Inhibitor_I29 domain-containing protein n=1 Tax=Heligmosomoides polygyrus TaxID=6339 RepID=A0A183G6U2_HELPZ|nr:unnamed protein product [Heligmosomoides polygyrus]